MINRRVRGIYGGLVDDSPMPFIKLNIESSEVAVILEVDPDALKDESGNGPKEATLIGLKSGAEIFVEMGSDAVATLLGFNGSKQAAGNPQSSPVSYPKAKQAEFD